MIRSSGCVLELCRLEGIIPALESSHALGYIKKMEIRRIGESDRVSLSGEETKTLKLY
jgi:tryptophan synthase beta chain